MLCSLHDACCDNFNVIISQPMPLHTQWMQYIAHNLVTLQVSGGPYEGGYLLINDRSSPLASAIAARKSSHVTALPSWRSKYRSSPCCSTDGRVMLGRLSRPPLVLSSSHLMYSCGIHTTGASFTLRKPALPRSVWSASPRTEVALALHVLCPSASLQHC